MADAFESFSSLSSILHLFTKMKYLQLLTLLPLTLAAPAPGPVTESIPELSLSQWSSIQSTFVDSVRSLGSWSWSTAQEVVQELESNLEKLESELHHGGETGEERTIWQQLKADPHSFSKLTKLIEVSYSFSLNLASDSLLTGSSLRVTHRRFSMTRISRSPSSYVSLTPPDIADPD